MTDLRIIYMGTPEFAVPSLQILVENGFNVVAVITAPDKPKGRGQKLATSPVKDYAVSQDIPVLQPTNLKSPEFIDELKSYNSNLQIVVAFRMLPEMVWDMPEIGTFNLHASLLPQYRGAAPINWAIINGEKETGVTTFFLKHEIDTGNIIFQEKEPIEEDDNVGDLYTRLMERGSKLVLKTVQAIQEDDYPQDPQDESGEIKHAPKIFKETCEIDWSKSSEEVYNFIRGLSPYPAAWTMINGTQFKIYKAEKLELTSAGDKPGDYSTDNKSYLHIQTGGSALSIKELQMQGKKRMNIKDFLRGNNL
ncbi:methionyl-tRNA formyltransferase [uncultured Roseivirga sp.]|uniref:methionyl-tRNA formyltransferase n=1 Tax=uncultured Roseivirga sp. TaxID=543088 RepID=UPI000D7B5070|nr:methionyl-tRNA formyltransferase [uncultured Roseivirga sp.]PWL29200.1 MAG: methionyl-tRNA formyltransferase [Roseivirga sp. XM-24bin3]